MSTIRVTVRAEITSDNGSTSVVERTLTPEGFGGNALFFADVVAQTAVEATEQVTGAVEAVHGVAPRPAAIARIA